MELSKQRQAEARKSGVTVQYLVMADLLSIGYSELDAYTIAYPENTALSALQNKSIREKILSSVKFKHLVEEKSAQRNIVFMGATSDEELIDKKKTAKLILTTALKLPTDSKERIEGLMKYSDLMGYKKDEVENDNTDTINFFLPLKCDKCPLLAAYNEYMKETGGQEIKPVEMGRLLSADDIKKR